MTILTRADIRRQISEVLPSADVQTPFDLRFARVSRAYIADTFAPEFKGILNLLRGTAQWAVAYDCDKFARTAAVVASMAHGRAQGFDKSASEGCTVGVVCYCVGGRAGEGHCINIIITEKGVEFWEPQTQKFVTLTKEERASAWLVIF